MLNSLLQDLRFALRGLRRSPAFTVTAIATLTLGIGANTALFSIVNGVLLSPLPFPQSDRLMYVYSTHGGSEGGTSFPNFLDWQRMNHSFAGLAAYRGDDFNLTGNGQPERIRGGMVTAGFFEMLDVRPLLGRTFSSSDDHPGAAPVAILGAELWKRSYNSNSDILGRTLTLSGTLYTIAGVAPANFRVHGSGAPFDLYVPIGQWNDTTFRNRNVGMGLNVVGRLKPNVGPAAARADMSTVAANLAAAYPEANKDTGTNLESWKTRMIGDSRDLLLVLTAAVGFVLLIACANVANLMLARATRRSREFAVRIALGAGRARIVRQLLTECLLLSMAGALLGWLLAALALRASTDGLAKVLPRSADVHLDGAVLIFTLAACLLSTVLFGLAPAWRAARRDL